MALPFIRPDILDMEEYQPVVPLDVLSEELGIPVEKLVKLDANENPYGPLPAVRQALAQCDALHIYPDPMQNRLRDALAHFLGLPRDIILAGAGSDELIDLIMRLVLQPGDCILNCPPTFGMYSFDAALHGARVIAVPRRPDFSLDLAGIERAVERHRPKLLFLACPNNPDGSVFDADTLRRLLALPLLVVVDEAYAEFRGESFIGTVPAHENLIVLRTFSKWAGLAGLRVGYGVFPPALMPHLWKIKQPYNINAAAQAAAIVSLEHADELMDIVRRIVQERERMLAGLRAIPWLQPFPSRANFVLCRVLDRPAVEVKLALRRQGILIRHFDKPGVSDCVRFSVGRPEHTDILLDALQRL
ncbi:MAG: histidinol-phosphate transaminase [Anaerolineae bacterium]